MLLDALLAARDNLIITYSGRDERSNLHRPPAVPVGELLDVIDHTVRGTKGRARDDIVVAHPLQPFDPRNFERGALVAGRPWSFDSLHLAGAEAALTPRQRPRSFLEQPLPPYESDSIGLDQLERFLRHPVRAFLRERLTVSLRSKTRDFEDAIPIELDALDRWQVADRVLQAQLEGASQAVVPRRRRWLGAVSRRADWPTRCSTRSPTRSTSWCGQARAPAPPLASSLDVHVELPGGRTPGRHRGGLAGRRRAHGDLLEARSRAAPHRLAPPARPDGDLSRPTLRGLHHRAQPRAGSSRSPRPGSARSVRTPQSRRQAAELHLRTLVDLFERGMTEPLPLYAKTSAAWADAVATGRDPMAAAGIRWASGFNFDQEDRDPEHLLVFGEQVSFDDLLALRGRAAVRRGGVATRGDQPGWASTRSRLWSGLLDCEQVVDQ